MANTPTAQSTVIHVPGTTPPGIFTGEAGQSAPGTNLVVVMDSGQLQTITNGGAVDHDRRVIYDLLPTVTPLDTSSLPTAIALEWTPERRAQRPPFQYIQQQNGTSTGMTAWQYHDGSAVVKSQYFAGNELISYDEHETSFSGALSTTHVWTDAYGMTAVDFDWKFVLNGLRDEIVERVAAPDGQGRTYRTYSINYLGSTGDSLNYKLIQGYVPQIWLKGKRIVGSDLADELFMEITATYDSQTIGDTDYTLVDAWLPIATLPTYFTKVALPLVNPPGDPIYVLKNGERVVDAYVTRHVDSSDYATVLRDLLTQFPPEHPRPRRRFTAAGGKVTVDGPRTIYQASLDNATLTAYGHTFTGGTWAALRDNPQQREDKTWDFSPTIILHASADTVTAIRQDGKTEHCSVAEFETRVLRIEAGGFSGFGPVGPYSHSWPPEWAWAMCVGETRAVCAHDPWRDSYKRNPPEHSPAEWTWKSRPNRRPRIIPDTAPRGLLGLTLADITGPVLHDDPVAKGEGPVRPPIAASSGGQNVLKRVGKRLPYSPAHIPDERDDRTSVRAHLTVTFGPLPPLPEGK